MKFFSAFLGSFLLLLTIFIGACSSPGSISKSADSKSTTDSSTSSIYPSWYNSSKSVISSATFFQGFGSAVAADSTGALKQATEQAKNNLESGISAKLESIRSEAVVELGSDSGLDSPRFIVVLRKAENEVSDVSKAANIMVEKNEPNGFRAFVEVEANKSELIDELDRRFSGYGNSWEALKNSEAFSSF